MKSVCILVVDLWNFPFVMCGLLNHYENLLYIKKTINVHLFVKLTCQRERESEREGRRGEAHEADKRERMRKEKGRVI